MKFQKGTLLEAKDLGNGIWYAVQVIEVDWEEEEILIHFEHFHRNDEWVPMNSSRLRPVVEPPGGLMIISRIQACISNTKIQKHKHSKNTRVQQQISQNTEDQKKNSQNPIAQKKNSQNKIAKKKTCKKPRKTKSLKLKMFRSGFLPTLLQTVLDNDRCVLLFDGYKKTMKGDRMVPLKDEEVAKFIKIGGKRGYVPKNMIKETEVFKKELNFMVPTGGENLTKKLSLDNKVHEDHATSVPSTSNSYSVVDGTTIYENTTNNILEAQPTETIAINMPQSVKVESSKTIDASSISENVPNSSIILPQSTTSSISICSAGAHESFSEKQTKSYADDIEKSTVDVGESENIFSEHVLSDSNESVIKLKYSENVEKHGNDGKENIEIEEQNLQGREDNKEEEDEEVEDELELQIQENEDYEDGKENETEPENEKESENVYEVNADSLTESTGIKLGEVPLSEQEVIQNSRENMATVDSGQGDMETHNEPIVTKHPEKHTKEEVLLYEHDKPPSRPDRFGKVNIVDSDNVNQQYNLSDLLNNTGISEVSHVNQNEMSHTADSLGPLLEASEEMEVLVQTNENSSENSDEQEGKEETLSNPFAILGKLNGNGKIEDACIGKNHDDFETFSEKIELESQDIPVVEKNAMVEQTTTGNKFQVNGDLYFSAAEENSHETLQLQPTVGHTTDFTNPLPVITGSSSEKVSSPMAESLGTKEERRKRKRKLHVVEVYQSKKRPGLDSPSAHSSMKNIATFQGGGGKFNSRGGRKKSQCPHEISPLSLEATSLVKNKVERHKEEVRTDGAIAMDKYQSAESTVMFLRHSKWLLALPQSRRAAAAPHLKLDTTTSQHTPCVSIRDLPVEMLLEVFSWLDVEQLVSTVSPVCQLWHDLSHRSALWRRGLELQDCTTGTNRQLRMCPNLNSLSISDREDADLILSTVALRNKELRCLTVKRCKASPSKRYIASQVLEKVLQHCPHLVDLTVKHCAFRSKFFSNLGTLAPELRRINFNYSSFFSLGVLKQIALNCKKLEEIRLLSNLKNQSCCDQELVLLSQHLCKTLKVLKINGPLVSDVGMAALVQCCHLRSLCIRFAFTLTDQGVSQLIQLPNLVHLELSGVTNENPRVWEHLFLNCGWTHMTKLSLSLCRTVDDNTLQQVAHACPNLVELNLAGCRHVTRMGLSAVVQSCKNLEYLNVCFVHTDVFRSFALFPTCIPLLKQLVYHPCTSWEETLALRYLCSSFPSLKIVTIEDSYGVFQQL